MPQVIVDISEDGSVKVEAREVSGTGCQQLTRAIEQALGTVTGDVKKPEFHRAVSNAIGNQAQAGR